MLHHEHFGHRHHHRHGVFGIIGLTMAGIVLAVLFALAFGWLIMLLWNWLMPDLFGLKTITYWQGFGLSLLGKLIFGGFHGHKSPHHRHFKHRGFWCGNGDESSPGGDRRNWIYYRQYWNERGRKDFDEYVERMKATSKESE